MRRHTNIMRVKRFFKFFSIAVAILIGGFLVVGQIAYQTVPIIDPPGKMYSVDDTKIHMYCTGPENNAQPTIIIIAGGGTQSPVLQSSRISFQHSSYLQL